MKELPIKKAVLRLSVTYTLVLVLLSAIFSFSFYEVSSREFDNNANLQRQLLLRRPEFRRGLDIEITTTIDRDANTSKERLRNRVLLVNLIVMLGGAAASYLFAKRTLRPIEEAHQVRIQFTADASHELRTPIAAMRAEIDVHLRDTKATKTELIDLLHSNNEELEKVTHLSERLLALARGDTEDLAQTSEYNLKTVVQESIDMVSALGKKHKISFSNKVPKGQQVFADKQKLIESLVILFDNAIKYGGKNTTVISEVVASKSGVVLRVSDDGAGVKESEITDIFKRFYRADSSRTNDGHGLGLSIARQNLELMGARIEATPNKPSGITFSITFTDTPSKT